MKKYCKTFYIIFILSLLVHPNENLSAQSLAFPTAEGFGKYTTGGRGGKLYIVSNLNDSGSGSLREAIEASGKRIIVFNVSGIIRLKSGITIRNGDLTILGQSAPGDGICVANYTVQISASNIIIRYLRFRPGSYQTGEYDASWGRNNSDIIIDHCSFSWGNDEQASFYDNANFTMQYCIISESFYASTHPKGNHGYGGIWGGMGASFHHNLIANHTSRTPRFCGARYHLTTASTEIVDFRNNVIFNWGYNSVYGGEAGNYNMINNYYKPGPATSGGSVRYRIVNPSDKKSDGNPLSKWYISGNYMSGNSAVTSDNWNGGVQPGDGSVSLSELKRNSAIQVASVITQTAQEAYNLVLASAGASLKRDAVDQRAVDAAIGGSTNYGGSFGANKGIIDNENQVGGFPIYSTYEQIKDTDKDGIDDEWEAMHGLTVGIKDDAGDQDGNGYSNIEDYCNCLIGEGDGCDIAVNRDCNGVADGTAVLDVCGVCTGGNTGIEPCPGAMEGESFCSAIGIKESTNSGFIGEGYVNFENISGSTGTWNMYSEKSQTVSIGIRYANGGSIARGMSVTVNGSVQANFTGNTTGSWTTWKTEYINLDLSAGVNTILLTALTSDGGPNVDLFVLPDKSLIAGSCEKDCNGEFSGVAFTDECGTCVGGSTGKEACTQDCEGNWGGKAYLDDCNVCISSSNGNQTCSGFMEAEEACWVDGILLESKNDGFSGEGYVNADNAPGASANWRLNSNSSQTVTLSFRFANGGTSRDGVLIINGNAAGTLALPATGAWTSWQMSSIQVNLIQGSNEITLSALTADGLANIDLISYSEGVSNGLCVITGLNANKESGLKLYPNPTKGKVALSQNSNWELINSMGTALQTDTSSSLVDLTTHPEGIYYLIVDGIPYKIIKK